MEQMGSGLLELLQKYTTMNQMNLSQIGTSSASGESEFGKLLEQKSSETVSDTGAAKTNSSDTRTDKTSNTEQSETTDKTETTDTVEKTEPSEKEDTEVCDVAREIACAQMVWVVPQVTEEASAVTGETVETMETGGDTVSLLPQSTENIVLPSDVQNEVMDTATTVVDTMGQQEQPVSFEQTMDTVSSVEVAQPTQSTQPETVDTTAVSAEQEAVHPQEPIETETVEHAVQTADTKSWDAAESSLSQEDGEDDLTGEMAVETAVFKDVETAPIKVAEAPAESQAPELKEQVSEQVVKVLESGENRVEIQLQPEALGKLTIEVSRSADGSLHVALHAENAQTRSLLERTMGSLHEVLTERGQNSVQIEVSQNEETQRQNQQQQDLQDGGNHQQQQQRRRQETSSEDFLQQLRLGLIDFGNEEES